MKKNTSVLESFPLKTKRNMDSNGGPIFEVSSFFFINEKYLILIMHLIVHLYVTLSLCIYLSHYGLSHSRPLPPLTYSPFHYLSFSQSRFLLFVSSRSLSLILYSPPFLPLSLSSFAHLVTVPPPPLVSSTPHFVFTRIYLQVMAQVFA